MKFEMPKMFKKGEQSKVSTNEQTLEKTPNLIKVAIEKVTTKIQEIISTPQSVVEKKLQDTEKRKEIINKVLWMAAAITAAGVAVGGLAEMVSLLGGPDNDFGHLSPADAYKPLMGVLTSIAGGFATVYSIAQLSIENRKNVNADVKEMKKIDGIAA